MSVYPLGNPGQQERDRLLAEVNLAPDDPNAVFRLAQHCFDAEDFASARSWFSRRAEMGGWDEEIFVALLRIAQSMHRLDEPWPNIQDAYLRAWEYRPTRAEPLYLIAYYYRWVGNYPLGYLFAERAANIPRPDDTLYVMTAVYDWRALDEQGICASWISKKPESYRLFRRILSRDDITNEDRERLIDYCRYLGPVMANEASDYREGVVRQLSSRQPSAATGTVTVAIPGTPDREAVELTLNSFLNCCTDIDKVHRFVLLDNGMDSDDQALVLEKYPFLESTRSATDDGRFTLTLVPGWAFVDREPILGRLTAVFEDEPDIGQVTVNNCELPTTGRPNSPPPEFRISATGERYVLSQEPVIGHTIRDATRNIQSGPRPTVAVLDEMLCFTKPETAPAVSQT
jgi:hypothetical protein